MAKGVLMGVDANLLAMVEGFLCQKTGPKLYALLGYGKMKSKY